MLKFAEITLIVTYGVLPISFASTAAVRGHSNKYVGGIASGTDNRCAKGHLDAAARMTFGGKRRF